MSNKESAKTLVKAIQTMASKPENLANFESYLSNHFSEWLEKFANTPELIAGEVKEFAEMEI